jgi:integrase
MLTDTKVQSIRPPASGQAEHRDHKVTGLRLRVGTSGKKSWILRARAGEKLINRKLGVYPAMGLAAARTAAETALTAIARDGNVAAIDRSFGEVAGAWLDKKRADRARNKSVDLQARRLELHVLPKWRDRRIVEIRRSDVRELVEGIEGDVLPNRVLTVIRTIFRFALSREWLDASPAEGISKPKDEFARDRFLDMDEVGRVWAASKLLGYPFGPYVQAMLLTGQRRTEVAAMRWDEVDLDAATWLLKAADTKGDRAHLVPLSPSMIELLKGLPRFGEHVFTSDGRTHINGFAKIKARLDKLVGASGKPPAAWTFHDLRRTVSTHMARLSVHRDIRGRVLNHAVQGVTDRHYTPYDFAPDKREALDKWSAEVARGISRED